MNRVKCVKSGKITKIADKSCIRYLEDKGKEVNKDIIIYCADMEKVIMLPHLDMFKSAIFTHSIVSTMRVLFL